MAGRQLPAAPCAHRRLPKVGMHKLPTRSPTQPQASSQTLLGVVGIGDPSTQRWVLLGGSSCPPDGISPLLFQTTG